MYAMIYEKHVWPSCTAIQGGPSGRGTLFVDIKLKVSPKYIPHILTRAHFLFQCQWKLVINQMNHAVLFLPEAAPGSLRIGSRLWETAPLIPISAQIGKATSRLELLYARIALFLSSGKTRPIPLIESHFRGRRVYLNHRFRPPSTVECVFMGKKLRESCLWARRGGGAFHAIP